VEPVVVAAIDWDEFLAWAERVRPSVDCRVRMGNGRWRTGYLSVEVTVGGGQPRRVRVRVSDPRRAARSRYYTLVPRSLENGGFQIKAGARYRPITPEDLRGAR
jgi:hypothetical protein